MLTNLLRKGMKFRCVQDFYMDDDSIAYYEGEVYECETDGMLTDAQNTRDHQFSKENEYLLFYYFRPVFD